MENELKSTKILNGLKSIRLFCFLAIYFIHSYPNSKIFSNLAFVSISIYIILSSFILSYRYQYENVDSSIKGSIKFGINRIKNLYPLHIITTIFFFVFFSDSFLINEGFKGWLNLISPALIEHILLIQSWSLNNTIMKYCNAVSWFLSAILFLYFMFPLIRKYTKNLEVKKSLLVIFIVVLFQALIYPFIYPFVTRYIDWGLITYYFPLARLGEFVCGSCLFNVWHELKDKINFKLSNILELLYLLIIILFSVFFNIKIIQYMNFIATTIAMISIFLFANCKGFITKTLTNKTTVKLGDYSNYAWIIHCFFVQFLPYLCSAYSLKPPTILYVFVGIVLSLYIGYLYCNYIRNRKEYLPINEDHIYEIDLIRVLCAIGIISLHFCCESNIKLPGIYTNINAEYSFILNGCFLLVSGFVLKARYPQINSLKEYFLSRFKSIYPCFWFAWAIFAIREYLLNGVTLFDYPPLTYLLNITGFDGFLYGRVNSFYLVGEWFLGAIIICYIVYPIINKLIDNKKKLICLIFVFSILHMLMIKLELPRLSLSGQSMITCILEMLLGVFLYQNKNYWNNKLYFLLAFVIFEFFIFIKIDNYLCFFMPIHVLSFFVLLYNFGTILNDNAIYKRVISFLSKYSYCFYLVQHIVIYTAICRYSPTNVLEGFLVVCLSIFISFVLSVLVYHTGKKIYYLLIESHNRKRNIIITTLLIITTLSCVYVYQYIEDKNSVIDNIEDYTICNSSINYYVDSALIVGNEVVMKGWAYPLDKNVVNFEIGVEVYGKIYIADKTYRDDVQEVFSLESNLVGFTISLNNNEYYQICIIDKNNKVIYK